VARGSSFLKTYWKN